MRRHNVSLSDPLSRVVRTQVKIGRYKDFSAAIQDAAWHFFMRSPDASSDYDVTPAELEASARRDLNAIHKDRRAGKLKSRKPSR